MKEIFWTLRRVEVRAVVEELESKRCMMLEAIITRASVARHCKRKGLDASYHQWSTRMLEEACEFASNEEQIAKGRKLLAKLDKL